MIFLILIFILIQSFFSAEIVSLVLKSSGQGNKE